VAENYLLALTAVAGLIDAVSFIALRLFTVNMIGNIVLLGFAVAGTRDLSATRSITALVCFMTGAMIGGRISSRSALACEGPLLLAAASASAVLSGGATSVIILTAVAMGIRTAAVRKLGIADLTTTVLTLTITGLAADSSLAGGINPRWKRRAVAIGSLFAGAVAGAMLLRHSMALPLAVAAVISTVCAIGMWQVVSPPGEKP
jgi:uncharacterized membrane protein YoaK (UPF0700 family)